MGNKNPKEIKILTGDVNPLDTYKILVGSPVFQKPKILAAFLSSLKHLNHDGMTLDYLFIDDNTDEASSQQLSLFKRPFSTVTVFLGEGRSAYICDEESHHWSDALMLRVANYKNTIIQYAIDNCYDALFFVDSDLVLHPDLVQHLRHQNKEIISEIFWSQWHTGLDQEPNVWLFDEYDLVPKELGEVLTKQDEASRRKSFLAQLRQPGIYEVGGLGACTLIAKSALLKGVNFTPISNLTIHGEDRFFCIRAAVLGIPLFVDTHCPAYHIYREPDLAGVSNYQNNCKGKKIMGTITLSMIVKNEAGRYLPRVLESLVGHIDAAVIIDDASTDDTVAICETILSGIPLHIVKNKESMFANEVSLRKLQWAETVKTNPDWILNLDSDEQIDDAFWLQSPTIINHPDFERCCFRLYDMWNETQYREDTFWNAHQTSRTFLLRYRPDFTYQWNEIPQHCGRFPSNCESFLKTDTDHRVQHFGWSNSQDRTLKHKRYQSLDPQSLYGIKEQYDSILEDAPVLIDWQPHEY